jgi:hypothetical protein
MSAPVLEATLVDEDTPHRQLEDYADTARQFDSAMRLALFLTKPIEFVSDAHCQIGSFDADKLRSLARDKAFQGPINRLMATSLRTGAEAISQETISRLATSPELRLATLILTAPLNETRNVALLLAGAVLSRRVRGLILKRDRNAILETLGVLGFHIAIHEAPLLYPLLTSLDRAPATHPLFQPDIPLNERQRFAAELGFQMVGRFLDAVEPSFADMYVKRLAANTNYADRKNVVGNFDDAHCNQFVRLIRRRQRTWSDIIG